MVDLQEKSIEMWRDAYFELHWKLRRAADRIEKLEVALREIAALDFWDGDSAINIARKTLEPTAPCHQPPSHG